MLSSAVGVLAVACLLSSADAFVHTPTQGMMLRGQSAVSSMRPLQSSVPKVRSASTMLRMEASEDDKAKASGIAVAVVGLIVSKFSLLIGILMGGAAVYAAKLPEEGDKGPGDTAKQVSLLIGTYAMKAFDYAKEKDAEQGFTKDLTDKIKSSVDDIKSSIKQ
eukprot:CAMPEP_0181320018 /NCGR_PEP_ID=MMETSP1101-20121128/17891_1 /TAXON_ID=46948 /ORGANISM="Rhodomonas abbreviata, Strain Caron Lab Isolate" /LENGTH=162 /DNA_ID=CAMNT_0023427677 /DNA_START=36 /DNA_END=524 /DNA_ORIENTATION=+